MTTESYDGLTPVMDLVEHRFFEGDVVRLKSGGPWMTVCSLYPTGEYECRWMFGGTMMFQAFKEVCLDRKRWWNP